MALSTREATRLKREWIEAKGLVGKQRYYFMKNLQRRGLTLEDFAWLLHRQSFRCANPGCYRLLDLSSRTGYHIDHDHSCCPDKHGWCGKCVRGVLCAGCNTALGGLGESPARIVGILQYLSKVSRTEQLLSRRVSNTPVENSPDIRHQETLFN